MAYTTCFALALGSGYAGIADLRAQIVDVSGASVGAAISTGFVEIGNGFYAWTAAAIPDGQRGGVKFYSDATPGTFLAFGSINPEEIENADAKTSTRATSATAASALDGTVVSGAYTYGDAQRLLLASQGGKTSGAGTAPGPFVIRDIDDSKDVVVATYDSDGNRLATTVDLTP